MFNARENSIDILYLNMTSYGRDIDIMQPVIVALQERFNLTVVQENLHLYSFAILKYRPKAVLFAAMSGNEAILEVSRVLKQLNIPIISLVTEGDYLPDPSIVNQMFWSFNKKREYLPSLQMVWSDRAFNLIRDSVEGSEKFNLKIGGSTGFDRYSFNSYMSKDVFLEKIGKSQYKKVVGIGSAGFSQFFDPYYSKNKSNVDAGYGAEFIELHRKSKELLNAIYKKLILENPDILFVLKFHPHTKGINNTELSYIEEVDNTVHIVQTKLNIADIINACDIWVSYDSTTCLEAWLLKKQTLLINPLGREFKRSIISKGSPIVETYPDVQKAIDNFYLEGEVLGFSDLLSTRETVIHDVIESDDGLNHIRTSAWIKKYFNDNLNSVVEYKIFNSLFLKAIIKASLRQLLFFLGRSAFLRNRIKIIKIQNFNMREFDYVENEKHYEEYKSKLSIFYTADKEKIVKKIIEEQ